MIIAQFVFSSALKMFALFGCDDSSVRGKNCRLRPNGMDDAGKWKCTRRIPRTQAEISFERSIYRRHAN
jgi:hypothetical protein